MARINIFGDFKANKVKHLNLSAELVYLLNTSDINMVNLEAPVISNGKPIKKSGPNLCQDQDSPEWLELRGFNAISIANNHIMDFGKAGLDTTINSFKRATVMGAGVWDDAYRINTFKTRDGLIIGVICCTHCEFGTLTERWDDNVREGCAWALSSEIVKNIYNSKRGVDFLVIFQHGGLEYMEQPLPECRERYRLWIDMGADAVIASHPHVPQGWETYKGKPILYSLGNFCFDYLNPKKPAPAHWYESICCTLDVTEPHECKVIIRPIFFDHLAGYISDYNNEEFDKHLQEMNATLCNETKFYEYVNAFCEHLVDFYINQFSRSGWITIGHCKGLLKGFIEGFLGRGFFSKCHAINNIRCESHRWAILRGLQQGKNK